MSLLALAFTAHLAAGQAFTPIGGTIYNGSGGPLVANTTYVVTSPLTVPAGQTLTIPSGVGVKFQNSFSLTVAGTLNVNGTSGAPVRFTSASDDTVGGDTNGNGPSTGSAGQWRGITFNTGATGSMTNAQVKFYGYGGQAGITAVGATLTATSVALSAGYTDGFDFANTSGTYSISNCSVTGTGGVGINNVVADNIPSFANDTLTSNGGNYLRITTGAFTGNRNITAANCPGGALFTVANLSVPAGVTLNLQAGVVVKFNTGIQANVDGTLHANGTAGSPVVLTSGSDDAFGGDTNNNGVSSGNPGQWRGLILSSTASASTLTSTYVRYAGYANQSAIELSACNATLNACHIDSAYAHGLDLDSTTLAATVTNCVFTGVQSWAVTGVALQAVPGFTNNSATSNGGNFMGVTSSTQTTNRTIVPANCLNGALWITPNITVPAGLTLTLAAGVCLKFTTSLQFEAAGTLICNGTSGNPVIFTSTTDDTASGDTNNNGPSAGNPGYWRGVRFLSTAAASQVHHLDVRFGGYANTPGIELRSANLLLDACHVVSTYSDGIDLNGGNVNQTSGATISNCVITGCGGVAINNVALDALAGMQNNTATGNGLNTTRVNSGSPSGNLTIVPANLIGSVMYLSTNMVVPAGTSLTLMAGVITKFTNSVSCTVNGTLTTLGTSASPVVFTDFADDSFGGDTNNNNASTGGPGAWRGITFDTGSSASFMTQTIVRHAGYASESGIAMIANPSLYTCTVADGYSTGIGFGSSASRPQIVECHMDNNGGNAMDGVPVEALQGLANNYASGNHNNIIRVVSGTPASDVIIGPQAGIAIAFVTNLVVNAGRTVTVLPATILKFANSTQVAVDGTLNIRGTGYEPVIFTSMSDDAYGGDSNGNGPSSGSPGEWRGIAYSSIASASAVEDVYVRHAGYASQPAFSSASAQVAARAVRVEFSYANGIEVSALNGGGANWVARNCGGVGIRLSGSNFPVAHATVTACQTGIAAAGWSGAIYNSISWANTTNFSGITSAQVFNSDGAFAGVNGNINADPQFLSPANGDYHLPPTSPCIAAGNGGVAAVVAKDFDEQPRVIDSNLGGTALPEMGAYERPVWTMDVNGVPRLGATVTFTVQGPAGSSIYVLGALDGSFGLGNFGIALAGLSPLILVTLPVGATLPITIPQDISLLGLSAGIQTLTIFGANPALGSATTLYRATVRP